MGQGDLFSKGIMVSICAQSFTFESKMGNFNYE